MSAKVSTGGYFLYPYFEKYSTCLLGILAICHDFFAIFRDGFCRALA